jgi:hypothetical protein
MATLKLIRSKSRLAQWRICVDIPRNGASLDKLVETAFFGANRPAFRSKVGHLFGANRPPPLSGAGTIKEGWADSFVTNRSAEK